MMPLSFREYQTKSRRTAVYPPIGHNVIYPVLELADEVGEVCGKIKKVFRDKGGVFSVEDQQALRDELGDVLWPLTQICTELGLPLEEVAEANLEKLRSRMDRNVIQGDGDNR